MSELGRREGVNDPLAVTGREQLPDRSLALNGVRAPSVGNPTGGAAAQSDALVGSMDRLFSVVQGVVAKRADDAFTEGKTAYLSGVTADEMQKTGNYYSKEGYNTLATRDTVNKWFAEEAINIDAAGKTMAPEEYQNYLGAKRKSLLEGITDPNARKVAVAAFEDMSPRLAQSQVAKASEYQKGQRVNAFSSALGSTAMTSGTKSIKDGPLSLTPAPVMQQYLSNDTDRDVGIRTLLGEAGNQGNEGMAAVAHVLRNRAGSGKFPSSIAGVAKQDKQFSVWNDGTGGNGGSVSPDDPMYKKAGEVYDAVMSGRHVDPTGGATHYYSPAGMKAQDGPDKPDWFDAEAGKAGGTVTIGGHVFAGKAGSGTSGTGSLKFAHANQEAGIAAPFKSILNDVSGAMGRPLTISSGYRDPNHPVEKAKGNGGGEHTHGTASDIDMSGMSDDERSQLVRELRSRGVMRFGTYDNEPNMLHVDMKDQNKNGTNWFMHNRSNGNMSGAPNWFQSAASEDPATITAQPAQSGTEAQNLIRGYAGLAPDEKATAVSDGMRRQLDTGDDSLFRDGGGVAMLYELGAKPNEIDEVLKAKARFDQKADNAYSAADIEYQDQIVRRAEAGEALPSLLADIETRHKSGELDDTKARTLATQAAGEIRQREKSLAAKAETKAAAATSLDDPDMLQELGGMYQRIKTGSANFEQASKEVPALAKKYGASEADVKTMLGTMFSLDQGRQDQLRTKTEQAAAAKAKQDSTTNEVTRAIAQGYGLGNVSGESLSGTNAQGQPLKMTPVEYGISTIKSRWASEYKAKVDSGQMSMSEAKPALERAVVLDLQKHDVVDKEMQAMLVGAVSGDIVTKDGKLTDAAKSNYDSYVTMRSTPNITEEYLSKVIGNTYARNVYELAYKLDGGNLTSGEGLITAKSKIDNGEIPDVNTSIARDAVFNSKAQTKTEELLDEVGSPKWWSTKFLFSTYDAGEVNRAVKQGSVKIGNSLKLKADAYHIQYPWQDPEVSLDLARQDIKRDTQFVGGNFLISSDKLYSKMGLSEDKADAAMKQYVNDYGAELFGKDAWGSKSFELTRMNLYGSAVDSLPTSSQGTRFMPEIKLQWMPSAGEKGSFGIMLVDDSAKGTVFPHPMRVIPAEIIGKHYIQKQSEQSGFDQMFDAGKRGVVDAAKDFKEFREKPPEEDKSSIMDWFN